MGVGSLSYLLGVLKLPPETLVHSFGGLLRTAHHRLDVDLKAAVQKLVDLPVIVVVIPARNKEASDRSVRTQYRVDGANGAAAARVSLARDAPDAEHAVDVVPDGPAQHAGVHVLVRRHGVVGQVVGHLELVVQHLTDVGVQPVDQGEAVILPTVVLPTTISKPLFIMGHFFRVNTDPGILQPDALSTCALNVGTGSPLLEKSL